MNIDKRLVLEYDEGQMTFRHLNPDASYSDIFSLAININALQVDPVRRVLLVTVNQF